MFNDTTTTEIYTLSLHGALPILRLPQGRGLAAAHGGLGRERQAGGADLETRGAEGAAPAAQARPDRKSTRPKSSHANIPYAVFCLENKYAHPLRNQTTTHLNSTH